MVRVRMTPTKKVGVWLIILRVQSLGLEMEWKMHHQVKEIRLDIFHPLRVLEDHNHPMNRIHESWKGNEDFM